MVLVVMMCGVDFLIALRLVMMGIAVSNGNGDGYGDGCGAGNVLN